MAFGVVSRGTSHKRPLTNVNHYRQYTLSAGPSLNSVYAGTRDFRALGRSIIHSGCVDVLRKMVLGSKKIRVFLLPCSVTFSGHYMYTLVV